MTTQRRPKRLKVTSLVEPLVTLEPEQAHYLARVLRAGVGDAVELFDGEGASAAAVIEHLEATRAVVRVLERRIAKAAACELSMGVAVPKGERADWLVEKLTELGITRLVWLTCERTVVTPRQAGSRRARWERLVTAAAAQSRRASVPELVGPLDLTHALDTFTSAALYIAHPGGRPLVAAALAAGAASATLLIGPEGGFTPGELSLAERRGYTAVGLGPHVMRVETAALAGAAVIMGVSGMNE